MDGLFASFNDMSIKELAVLVTAIGGVLVALVSAVFSGLATLNASKARVASQITVEQQVKTTKAVEDIVIVITDKINSIAETNKKILALAVITDELKRAVEMNKKNFMQK